MLSRKIYGRLLRLLLAAAVMMAFVPAPAHAEDIMVTVTGKLDVDTEGGFVLKAGGKNYLIEGDGLEEYIGQTVIVTGLTEKMEDGALYLLVDSIEPAQ